MSRAVIGFALFIGVFLLASSRQQPDFRVLGWDAIDLFIALLGASLIFAESHALSYTGTTDLLLGKRPSWGERLAHWSGLMMGVLLLAFLVAYQMKALDVEPMKNCLRIASNGTMGPCLKRAAGQLIP